MTCLPLLFLSCRHAPPAQEAPPAEAAAPTRSFTIEATGADPDLVARITGDVDAGVSRVEAYLGAPFPRPFTVRVLPDRAAVDAHWGELWQTPDLHTECWMVGMGMAAELSILSPTRWRDEACEHDPDDPHELQALIAHELTHTYHSQVNPVLEAGGDAADSMAWFVEGLAVVVSGQIDDGHEAPAREAIATGHAPARLAEAWSGEYRYGVSGSLVRFVDETWGRATVVRMLGARDGADLLAMIGVDEATLLERWEAWAR